MAWSVMLPLLLVAFFPLVRSQTPVYVTTKKGPIAGMNVPANASTTNIEFDAFLGIPYADKPVRFQLAKPHSAWTDTLSTVTDGPACAQLYYPSSEDCLYLNVYTPPGASASAYKLPVMVFVPGGGFTYGSGSSKQYGPDFLISGGIILVSINYRVGAAGFLSLGSKVAPGNLGLHDTLLALQWVQDEISVFGGDPTQVTLAGESAGSVIAHFHYLSPLSTGLFQRVIAQSGSALGKWGYVTGTEARRRALLLAKSLNCDTSQNDTMILSCLQKADINDVLGNQSVPLSKDDLVAGNAVRFVPVLDSNATADKPFFSDSLDNLIEAAASRAIPLISGFTADEGILIFSMGAYIAAEANLQSFLPEGERTTNKVNSIKTRYFNQTPTLNKIQGLVSLYTDYAFAHPTVKVIRKFANFTYGYLFDYDGLWGPEFFVHRSPVFYQYKVKGVAHADDMAYLYYRNQSLDTCAANINNVNMMKNMVKWWTNFVKTGVPDDSWPTIAEGGYFVIDSQPSIRNVTMFESQYYDFWASIENKTTSSADSAAVCVLTLFFSLTAATKYL